MSTVSADEVALAWCLPVSDEEIADHSLGWVTARSADGLLVGLGSAVVRRAVEEARAAGREWLFVDFEPHLATFYLESCGFRPTAAGLVHLTDG